MINEIRYDKTYILFRDSLEIGVMNFSKSDEEYTYLTIVVENGFNKTTKNFLLTKEPFVDDLDIESVNEILMTNGLTFKKYKD
ncbi:hypothetical protein [Staphylococcus chromogenes]|uniref:hypothetical protein n=1 Tax=Staphylococcus chromogenes TaxID=46126 RepID=UPI002884E8B9|nr:hypothetical protein [Staphylococcus chromogenes]MDT0700343.1 hypothetical protein [Staphylococcus chromogenes]